jgi:hypothetical protein
MTSESIRRVVVGLTLLTFTCTACTTRVQVALPRPAPDGGTTSAVEIGDRVRVTLRDGTRVEGKAEAVTVDSVSVKPSNSGSAAQRIMWTDVARLEREKVQVAKTILAVSLIGR